MQAKHKDAIVLAIAIASVLAAIFTAKHERAGGWNVTPPPARFVCEKPYTLIIQSPAMTRLSCTFRGAPGDACAAVGGDWIRMPDASIEWSEAHRKATLKHEIGHVCGWPAHHPR